MKTIALFQDQSLQQWGLGGGTMLPGFLLAGSISSESDLIPFARTVKTPQFFVRVLGGFVTIRIAAFFEDSKSSKNCEFMLLRLKKLSR